MRLRVWCVVGELRDHIRFKLPETEEIEFRSFWKSVLNETDILTSMHGPPHVNITNVTSTNCNVKAK